MNLHTKSIGLVLSGGGTKGLAHAGAIKFLEEQNIRPTKIAGTSAGSIVGAMYAWGKTPEQILDFFKSIYFFHWRHITFTKAGLIDSEAFKDYFRAVFKEAKLSDLEIPTQITATDMIKGQLTIFDSETRIVDALIASCSFPGVISPYQIIGVYVSPINNIKPEDLNSIRAVTTRAFDILSEHANISKFNQCDWIIQPKELSVYSTFETNKTKMDTIFNLGYEAAKYSFENKIYKI